MKLFGKRFIFAIVAVLCVSVVTYFNKYDGDTYLKLVGIITAIFTVGQSYTQVKEKQNGNGKTGILG